MIKYMGIIALIIYSILVLILVINLRKKNSFIKNSFIMLFSLLCITFLIYNQGIVNNCLKFFVKFIYFPSFDSYVFIVFLTMCILLYSIFSEKLDNKFRVINYVFASFLIVIYVIVMCLDMDIHSYNSLYSSPSIDWLRYSTRGFSIWIFLLLVIKYFKSFGSNGE